MTKNEQRWFICCFGKQVVYWFKLFELTRDERDFDRAERFFDELQAYLPLTLRDISIKEIVELIEGMLAGMPNRKDCK